VRENFELGCHVAVVKAEQMQELTVKREPASAKVEPGLQAKREPKQEPGGQAGGGVDAEAARREEMRQRKEFYRNQDPIILVGLLLAKDRKIESLHQTVAKARARCDQWRKTGWKTIQKWGGVKSCHRLGKKAKQTDQYHSGTGTSRGKLSPWGGVTVAMHRCLSSTSAWRIGTSLSTDVSRWTVNRWEADVSDCITKDCQEFHQRNDELLRKPTTPVSTPQWVIKSVMTDGTNKTVLRKQSVQVSTSVIIIVLYAVCCKYCSYCCGTL